MRFSSLLLVKATLFVGTNVLAEFTAPVNDILTDVENLVEDYIGHDDLRHRRSTRPLRS